MPFEQARKYVHKLGLERQKEWYEYCKSKDKPENIPSNASLVYRKEWKSWGDWLGTKYIAPQNRIYLPFEEARSYVRKLDLKNGAEWSAFCKSGKKPENIPMAANDVYKDEWEGFGDWLGTGNIATRNIKYRSFNEARSFVHKLKLKSQHEWEEYCKSGSKPVDIPQKAYRTYHRNWKGFGDWLGTNFVAKQKRNYRDFEEARKFVQTLGLKDQAAWRQYCKSGKKPQDIPSAPTKQYEKEWKGFGDWLGTGAISTHDRKHLTFDEARTYAR